MNVRSRLFGFGAAAVLSLSMMSGAMAATSDSTDVSVKLTPGDCTVSVDQSNINFGEWQYLNDEWTYVSGSKYHDVDIDVDVPAPGETCDVNVSLTDANDAYGADNGAGGQISGSYFNLDAWPYGAGHNDLSGPRPFTFAGTPLNASLWLESVPADAAPGTYSGTLNVAIVSAP